MTRSNAPGPPTLRRGQCPGDSHRESVHLVGRRIRWQDAPPGGGGAHPEVGEDLVVLRLVPKGLQLTPPTRGE